MDTSHGKRLTEWLGTLEGLAKAIPALILALAAIFAAVSDQIKPVFEALLIPPRFVPFVSFLIVIIVGFAVWRSFRRFANESRLEQPDRFTLVATTPGSLIGRDEDLARLETTVAKNRIVLLDGESGCGKSALVSAGLVPRLRAGSTLIPMLIRDWGDDWIRGPLAAALDALHSALTPEQRDAIDWTTDPDLAATAEQLAAQLKTRIEGVRKKLKRRLLVVADQFDDYQAQHRGAFIDHDGNWISADTLAATNPFWGFVDAGLKAGTLHLLAVTRADTASGLSTIRFLDKSMTADRQLPRVDVAFLRPLLAGIAPDGATPEVVSNPAHGWHELRERLQDDMRQQGAILMQQVRTLLLGLRQLTTLTVHRYRKAGETRGLEVLVVSRALREAGDAIGGGEHGLQIARRVLGQLVLPGGPGQLPKSQRRGVSELQDIAGGAEPAARALRVFRERDLARPAEGIGRDDAWQLDHDYLARAVLAEARQADRWGVALSEGLVRYRDAAGGWRDRWAALLPMVSQGRLFWEWLRGRVTYGDAASYARISAIKPAIMMALLGAVLGGTIAWDGDQRLTAAARRISDGFGGSAEAAAVMEAWRATDPVRERLYRLTLDDIGRLDRAMRSAWPSAHAGFETYRIRQSLELLRGRLGQVQGGYVALTELAAAYVGVVQRVTDVDVLRTEATALRTLLELRQNGHVTRTLVQAYVAVAQKLNDPDVLLAAATALRAQLERQHDGRTAIDIAEAYAAVAQKLNDPDVLLAAATALRAQLERPRDVVTSGAEFAEVYAAVVQKLNAPTVLRDEAAALRTLWERQQDPTNAWAVANAYAAVAQRLNDPTVLRDEATALRAHLERQQNAEIASAIAQAYAAVAQKLNDPDVLVAAAAALRAQLERQHDGRTAIDIARVYAAVAQKLNHPTVLRDEATALRAQLESQQDAEIASAFAQAYAAVAQKLDDPTVLRDEMTLLRAQMERRQVPVFALVFAHAYAAVAQKLTDPDGLRAAAAALREQLVNPQNRDAVFGLAPAYAAVARKLNDPAVLRDEATALRAHLQDGRIPGEIMQAYAAVVQKLNDPTVLRDEATALRTLLEQRPSGFAASAIVQAYAAVAQRLNDPNVLLGAATALRTRLEERLNSFDASAIMQAYAAVAQKLNDPTVLRDEATALRTHLERQQNAEIAGAIAQSYAAVVQKLNDPAVLRDEATALRTLLEQRSNYFAASAIEQAYAAVAQKLNDQTVLRDEATALREQLGRQSDVSMAWSIGGAYAAVAQRLNNPTVLRDEATALRAQLERQSSNMTLHAYVSVARRSVELLRQSDQGAVRGLATEALILAGHPHINDASPLLTILDSIAERRFGTDSGAAAQWWATTYSRNLDGLRPSPPAPR